MSPTSKHATPASEPSTSTDKATGATTTTNDSNNKRLSFRGATAGSMVSVWRAAFGSASRDPKPTSGNQNGADTNESNCDELLGEEDTSSSSVDHPTAERPVASTSWPSPSPSSSSFSSSTTETETETAAAPSFRVSVHKGCESSSDESEHDTAARERKPRRSLLDVLLQPDERGLGLNLALRPTVGPSAGEDGLAVVVASFRRCHPADIGPAEASQQIQVGDALVSIDGQRVYSLADVQRRLSTAASPSGFVLLRFVREPFEMPASEPHPVSHEPPSPVDACPRELSPAAALLIRELVTKNQVLEEQLMSSRLKQDEQRIQLDQLYALYARTQLESSSFPSFSMPRPLFRPSFPKPPLAVFSPKVGGSADPLSSPPAQQSKSSTSYSSMTPVSSPDIDLAIQAERERVTRHWEQRLERASAQLQAQHDAELQDLREAMNKKVAMLEAGVMHLLRALAEKDTPSGDAPSTSDTDDIACVALSPRLQLIRHRLLHQGSSQRHDDCVLCLLHDPIQQLYNERRDQPLRDTILALVKEQQARNTGSSDDVHGDEMKT
ncbi:hypothetical protein P43SY_001090 [Pythium insidiosum]|uniref:PDZ domain-containing protein n=1 Tax=Pythium insidiosum TaxID=114742 RepID=A0AAD5Q2U9_PYTIN|nr:hypothetical protein P43SY_001090 [Pythium insidiosum]